LPPSISAQPCICRRCGIEQHDWVTDWSCNICKPEGHNDLCYSCGSSNRIVTACKKCGKGLKKTDT
jgi:hypothetical protein